MLNPEASKPILFWNYLINSLPQSCASGFSPTIITFLVSNPLLCSLAGSVEYVLESAHIWIQVQHLPVGSHPNLSPFLYHSAWILTLISSHLKLSYTAYTPTSVEWHCLNSIWIGLVFEAKVHFIYKPVP